MDYIDKYGALIELGCGNGRDSVFLSTEKELSVIGVDQCQDQINFLTTNYKNDLLSFKCDDFTNLNEYSNKLDYVYSRFTLHSIQENEENRTLEWAYHNLKIGGKFMIELRSIKDELCGSGESVGGNAYVTDHYRRFTEYDEIISKIVNLGFNIDYSIEDKGLAVYKDEDPVVIRIVARK